MAGWKGGSESVHLNAHNSVGLLEASPKSPNVDFTVSVVLIRARPMDPRRPLGRSHRYRSLCVVGTTDYLVYIWSSVGYVWHHICVSSLNGKFQFGRNGEHTTYPPPNPPPVTLKVSIIFIYPIPSFFCFSPSL